MHNRRKEGNPVRPTEGNIPNKVVLNNPSGLKQEMAIKSIPSVALHVYVLKELS